MQNKSIILIIQIFYIKTEKINLKLIIRNDNFF